MSDSTLARRTEIAVKIDGVDISADMNKYLLSMTYTDHEEDKTDDLQISLDDREGVWLQGWLTAEEKGAQISAVIIQKNRDSDGKDGVLDCGVFEIDTLDGGGPPATASIKATSLPYSSTVRTELKTRAWENIKLSAIANEIAGKNGLTCMFLSSFDPLYTRREQMQISDIVFLQGLCKNAGISLKVSGNIIVLFDEADFESKPEIREIERGKADVISYRFGTSTNDTKYAKCHVSYTDPQKGETIEYTYTPRDADPEGQTLEINEKVNDREEARQLAMKRLRQKNKAEFSAEFTLVGDTSIVAGVTVKVIGYGMFDGKYIVETATHGVTASGYTLQVKLRRVLEGY
jgi:phage protein D